MATCDDSCNEPPLPKSRPLPPNTNPQSSKPEPSIAGVQFGYPSPGQQTPTGQDVLNHTLFLNNQQWKKILEDDQSNNYDIVIVGSGICGLAVAHRALQGDVNDEKADAATQRDPKTRILMLERGPVFLPEHFQNLPEAFVKTLGGRSETFPWTLARETATGRDGTVTWQHGMVPFFGGRSTLWSSWCPTPTDDEMLGWPAYTIEQVRANLDSAKQLLNVQDADQVDSPAIRIPLSRKYDDKATRRNWRSFVERTCPVYGALQTKVQERLEAAYLRGNPIDKRVYRAQAAPLASDGECASGIDFLKWSSPGPLLKLVEEQAAKARAHPDKAAPLHVVNEVCVRRILHQGGVATGLETNRGVLPLRDAKLVLAMGTLPPTTLIQSSFAESPDLRDKVGQIFSAHFITSIVARVPRALYETMKPCADRGDMGDLEIAACYVAGTAGDGKDFKKQFHVQLSALADKHPEENGSRALRYMPDVVATATKTQLCTSRDHVVFVCAVLGELDTGASSFKHNAHDGDPTTASMLRLKSNTKADQEVWDAMDDATFTMLEQALSANDGSIEYWHAIEDPSDPEAGEWKSARPPKDKRRVPATVHESSTLHIGSEASAPVDLNYKLRGSSNVYVTGGGLWPRGGSWNPTLTMAAMAMDLADHLYFERKQHETAE